MHQAQLYQVPRHAQLSDMGAPFQVSMLCIQSIVNLVFLSCSAAQLQKLPSVNILSGA